MFGSRTSPNRGRSASRQRNDGSSAKGSGAAQAAFAGTAGETAAEADRILASRQRALARRLERTDILARLGPALGLAGTLIPLGPGLTALQQGDVTLLATALTVAFDTTVMGLVVGVVAFILSRVRRRWYESELEDLTDRLERSLELGSETAQHAQHVPVTT